MRLRLAKALAMLAVVTQTRRSRRLRALPSGNHRADQIFQMSKARQGNAADVQYHQHQRNVRDSFVYLLAKGGRL